MAKKETKEKIERSYNVPLRKSFRETAKYKKTPRAIRALRAFLQKHMKCEEVKLGMHLNEHMWKHGIKNPPHHIKVHVIKEDDVVKAELEGFEFKEAIKSAPKKKGPETMKDKLAAKLGVKEEAAEEKKEETKEEEKEEETPTAHELAAKKKETSNQ